MAALLLTPLPMAPLTNAAARAASLGGVVENRTLGQLAAGVEVQLIGESESSAPRIAVTDARGRFSFEGVAPGAYGLVAMHRKIPYVHRDVKVGPNGAEVTADLEVYDTTGSDEYVSIESLHVLIHESDGRALVTEMAVLANRGNRTYVGGFSPASPSAYRLALTLPSGYTGLEAPEGIRERITNRMDAGFDLAMPLLPGSTRILYAYTLPYGLFGVDLTRRVAFRTDLVNLVLPASSSWRVRSEDLASQVSVELEGRMLAIARGGPFAKGAVLHGRIAGGLLGTGVPSMRVAYGVAGLAVAGLTLFWIVRFRRFAG